MAVPDLNLSAIVAPIPGDNPGGTRMPFMIRQKLEAARKEMEPNPDDPSAAPIPKKAEWSLIVRTANETLAQTSKDLETALRLLEALTKMAGFEGLKLGMVVLKEMVDQCWDFLHPIPDPADGEGPEIRAERFNWIGDMDAGAYFPHTVRQIPFLRVSGSLYSMQDRQATMESKGPVSSDDMSRAVLDDGMGTKIAEAYQAFMDLDRSLTDKLNNQAPGMVGLRQSLEEINELAGRLSGGAATTEETPANGESPAAGGGGGGGMSFSGNSSSVASREEAYRVIGQVADALARIEPHSPIPHLLRRAVELGRMPFPRLIKELIRDEAGLSQVYREFGIKADDVPS